MCFEFEWLYWAQLAQEKARNEDLAAKAQKPAEQPVWASRSPAPEESDHHHEPAHA
jgi:hypothetical protein